MRYGMFGDEKQSCDVCGGCYGARGAEGGMAETTFQPSVGVRRPSVEAIGVENVYDDCTYTAIIVGTERLKEKGEKAFTGWSAEIQGGWSVERMVR